MQKLEKSPARIAQRPHIWLLTVIAVVLVGWALRAMSIVFVPIVCSVFLTLLVYPVDRWVAGRMPSRLKWFGHVAALGIVLLVIAIFFGSIWLTVERLQERFPEAFPEVGQVLSPGADEASPADAEAVQQRAETGDAAEVGASAGGGDAAGAGRAAEGGAAAGNAAGGSLVSQFTGAFEQARDLLGQSGLQFVRDLISSAGTLLAGLALVVFLTLLMLVEQPLWRAKLEALTGSTAGQWLQPIGTVAAKIRRYLLARTILGLLTATLYGLWLWIFGIDLLIVWALLTFILNFIPNLGSLISGVLPVLYAFATKDLQTAIFVGVGILAIEQVIGNYVDPLVQGRQVSISPVLVLVVLLIWSWIWGAAGAVLAVPITVTALVFFAHVPALRPFALLLSREGDMEGLSKATDSE